MKLGRGSRLDPTRRRHDGLEGLQAWTDQGIEEWDRRAICPATGQTVHESWRRELEVMRPVLLLPEPLDVAVTRRVGRDCLVAFKGRQYAVPFRYADRPVEVRGCAGVVQIWADGEVLKEYPCGTDERLLMDPACFEGEATDRMLLPPPRGRMGRRLQEIYEMPVELRPIDLCRAGRDGPMSPANAAPAKKGRVDLDRTRESLIQLGLEHAAERVAELLTEAPAHQFLDRLLEAEIRQREERRIKTSLRLSRLPTGYTLTDFDWAFQPSVEKGQIETLDRDAGHLRLDPHAGDPPHLGPPGVGKTHLRVALGVKAVENGLSVAFFRLDNLLHVLKKDAEVPPQRLRRKKSTCTSPCW